MKTQAATQFASGVPFVSDTDLKQRFGKPTFPPRRPRPSSKPTATPRLQALRSSLLVVALDALAALLCSGMIPPKPVGLPAHTDRQAEQTPAAQIASGQ